MVISTLMEVVSNCDIMIAILTITLATKSHDDNSGV